MQKTALLLFDRQLPISLGALKKLHNCFSIIFIQSLPGNYMKALLELRNMGWKIEAIPFIHESLFIKKVKEYLRQNRIQSLVLMKSQENHQKKMGALLKKNLKISVALTFEKLVMHACLQFQYFIKKNIKKYNELSFQKVNRKFNLFIDEYEELIVEGLSKKILDIPKELARLKTQKKPSEKKTLTFAQPFSFSFEEEKEI